MALSLSDFAGDAFSSDKRGQEIFGIDLIDRVSDKGLPAKEELPLSKSNVVALIKPDLKTCEYRNMLAVADTFICYSVKRTILRVIQTVSSQKGLLRGHEATIVDVKFSVVDSRLLCSVDDGGSPTANCSASTAHFFVWNLESSAPSTPSSQPEEIKSSIVCALGLQASIVQPHPQFSHLWVIAKTDAVLKTAFIGIVSSQDCNNDNTTAYESLPMHVVLPRQSVTDLSISSCGKYLVASVSQNDNTRDTNICVWKINFTADLGDISYRQSSLTPCYQYSVPYCVAVRALPIGVVCASQRPQSGNSTEIKMTIQVWPLGTSTAVPDESQTIHLTYPVAKTSANVPINVDEIGMGFDHINFSLNCIGSNKNAVVLAHRRSPFVTCLALNPLVSAFNHSALTRLPIHHVTFLTTATPPESISCTIIAGREHHSEEDISHLELACYQTHETQYAVQQFHVALDSLYSIEHLTAAAVPSAMTTSTGSPTIASFVGSSFSLSNSNNSSASLGAGINITSLLSSSGILLGPNSFQQLSSSTPTAHSSSSRPPLAPPSPLTATASSPIPIGKSFLGSSPSATAAAPAPAPVPTAEAAVDPVLAGLPIFGAVDASQGGGLLSRIQENRRKSALSTSTAVAEPASASAAAAPVPTPVPVPVPAPAAASLPPVRLGTSILGEFKSILQVGSVSSSTSSSSNSNSSSSNSNSNSSAPTTTTTSTLSNQFSSSVAAESVNNVNIPATLSVPVSAASFTSNKSTVPQQVTSDVMSSEAMSTLSTQLEETVDCAIQRASDQSTQSIIMSVQNSLKDLISEQSKQSSQSASQLSNTLSQTVKQSIERETKKQFESSVKAAIASDALASAIAANLLTSINGQLRAAVQNSVEATLKESLKQEIVSGFRTSFENVLLPAFQAGTNKMFSQIQSVFEEGMGNMICEVGNVNRGQLESMSQLKAEIVQLRSTVSELESKVSHLSYQLASGATAAATATAIVAEAPPSPIDLFKQGKISESVEAALELKDVTILIHLLSHFATGPKMLAENCSGIVQLCTIQQLASDFATQTPVEGLAIRMIWLKELLLNLYSNPSITGLDEKTQLGPIMSSVLQQLRAAESRIMSSSAGASSSSSAEGGLMSPTTSLPSEVLDLRMMIMLLSQRY